MTRRHATLALACILLAPTGAPAGDVDLARYRPECGITATPDHDTLALEWPVANPSKARLVLDLKPHAPLFQSIALIQGTESHTILEHADPAYFLLVGERRAPGGRPPGMSVFNTFFDSPALRPFDRFASQLDPAQVRVQSRGARASVVIEPLTIGPFHGRLEITIYRGSPLIHVEAVAATTLENRAILYDTGLALADPGAAQLSWIDRDGNPAQAQPPADAPSRALGVRGRALALAGKQGSIAVFPPPHQYFFPRDLSTNLATTWFGKGHRGLDTRFGFGIGQAERGGGAFAPWFNAPPRTDQRMGVFYLLSDQPPAQALEQAAAFTHHDRYPKLAGYHTFSPHWHLAVAAEAAANSAAGRKPVMPEYVKMFKDMGVEIVQLAEFHGDGHPQDPGPIRLRELATLFGECRRLSDSEFLLLPGEEANIALGPYKAGREAGHWVYLFPRPVFWTMKRGAAEPFHELNSELGSVYHVGSGDDMVRLLNDVRGLAWTSHPRVKGSSWTPDLYRDADFFKSAVWLGASWKAMPADLSTGRLGARALDLLDDMSNWGARKFMPGEVDVFKLDHTHELYAHMNVNYVRLEPDRLPRFDLGWSALVEALRLGRFFVSTGEVLIERFTLAGRGSGQTAPARNGQMLSIALRWTFPLDHIDILSGDGARVHRQRVDMADAVAFDKNEITIQTELTGRTWIRAEAWDVAGNGAFTQPIWLEPDAPGKRSNQHD